MKIQKKEGQKIRGSIVLFKVFFFPRIFVESCWISHKLLRIKTILRIKIEMFRFFMVKMTTWMHSCVKKQVAFNFSSSVNLDESIICKKKKSCKYTIYRNFEKLSFLDIFFSV